MVACLLILRFALRIADGDRLDGPAALAPLPGQRQVVGEVSKEAEADGVRAGMPLGEALSRCPSLRLLSADPARAAEVWEQVIRRLEGIGAAVESEQAGEAFFTIDGLLMLHGGEPAGVMVAARDAARVPVRIAAAPNRFAALLAARRGSWLPRGVRAGGGEAIVPERALRKFLAPFPVASLSARLGFERPVEELIGSLKRLGLDTLGKLAALSPDQVADRFGPIGLQALRLARGEDTPLRPREPHEELSVEIELPDGIAGAQLDRALELLVDRLLADPRRKGRTMLALRLSAQLCGGGSWSIEQGLGRPTALARTIASLLLPRLQGLPGPTDRLALRVLALGPQDPDQLELSLEGARSRRGKVAAAVREVRAASGPEALLKVIDADSRSHLPERRYLLTPYPA